MNYEERLRRLNVSGTPHYTGDKAKYVLGFEGDVFEIIREADKELEELSELNRIFKVREAENQEREFVLEEELEAKDKLIGEIDRIVNGFYADEGASLSSVFGKIRRLLTKGPTQ